MILNSFYCLKEFLCFRCTFLWIWPSTEKGHLPHFVHATRIIKNKRLNLQHANFDSVARFVTIYLFICLQYFRIFPFMRRSTFYCSALAIYSVCRQSVCARTLRPSIYQRKIATAHLTLLFAQFLSTSCMMKTTQIMQRAELVRN